MLRSYYVLAHADTGHKKAGEEASTLRGTTIMNDMDLLPLDVLPQIFAFFDRGELRHCALVCRDWQPFAQAILLRSITFMSAHSSGQFLSCFGAEHRVWGFLHHLKVWGMFSDGEPEPAVTDYVCVLQQARRLETLTVGLQIQCRAGQEYILPLHEPFLEASAPWLTHMLAIDVGNQADKVPQRKLVDVFQTFPKIRGLQTHLRGGRTLADSFFVEAGKHLEVLYLHTAHHHTHIIASTCSNLETLLLGCFYPDDSGWLAQLKRLKTVALPLEPALQQHLDSLPSCVVCIILHSGRPRQVAPQSVTIPSFLKQVWIDAKVKKPPHMETAADCRVQVRGKP